MAALPAGRRSSITIEQLDLSKIAESFLDSLPWPARQRFCQNMEILARGEPGRKLLLGTGCAGTDMPVFAFKALLDAAKRMPGVQQHLQWEHSFSCEIHAKKREWLHQVNAPGTNIFADICELAKEQAFCTKTCKSVQVPKVSWLITGWSCKDVSVMNTQRGKFKNSVAEKVGTTATTFHGLLAYCQRQRPPVVIGENVVQLLTRKHQGTA